MSEERVEWAVMDWLGNTKGPWPSREEAAAFCVAYVVTFERRLEEVAEGFLSFAGFPATSRLGSPPYVVSRRIGDWERVGS